MFDVNMQEIHKLSFEDFFNKVKSSPRGLTQASADERLKHYGYNKLSEEKKKNIVFRLLEQFKNFFSILLLVGALLSFLGEAMSPGEGSIYVGYALIGVTILNAFFTFLQEFRAEKAMSAFKNLMPQKITILRNGREIVVESKFLVPGDVILLSEGDKIPADARIIEERLLKVDHSALTGESEPQLRSLDYTSNKALLSRNMLFSGTLVQSGNGKAVVIRTGDHTEIGQIANLTRTTKSAQSRIQIELGHFVKVISIIAIALGISFFGLGLLIGRTFWEALIFAIGIIVANVPEGLLPTVTLTLSISAQRMAKHKALVKNMEAIETLGSVSTICTDKTGTLTENRMRVTAVVLGDEMYHYDAEHDFMVTIQSDDLLKFTQLPDNTSLLQGMVLCNNARHTLQDESERGDPTEVALIEFAHKFSDVHWLQHEHRRTHEIPFDSDKKYMVTANVVEGSEIAFIKGAPEIVLNKCKYYLEDGKKRVLNDKLRNIILTDNNLLSSEGYRVLAFAKRELPKNPDYRTDVDSNNFTFTGLVSMSDPPRAEVANAVSECRAAGIRTIIISGDQGLTVKAVALKVGIVQEGESVTILTSKDLSTMTNDELKSILLNTTVLFARALPQDKLRVVEVLQELGEVVAVTGDGVNDAPALKRADVGISMGVIGTDVAKEASDIVLMDDNFATIVKAIKSGRTVYDNIKNFITYILTSNIPEILPFLFFVIFGWPLALPVLLILAIDLGTDMLPAIALGMETSEGDVMKKPPRNPKAKLLTGRMLFRSYGIIGPLEALFSYLVFFGVLFSNGWSFGKELAMNDPLYMSAITAFFVTIVVIQMFNVLACRTNRQSAFSKGINKMMIVGWIVEITLILLLIFVPFLNLAFGTATFPAEYIIWMVLSGVIILLIEEIRKFLYRKTGRFGVY